MPPETPRDPSIEARIRDYVVKTTGLQEPLADDDSLVDKGFISSIRLLDLAGFLEDTFRVRLRAIDLAADNLSTVAKIAALVRARLSSPR